MDNATGTGAEVIYGDGRLPPWVLQIVQAITVFGLILGVAAAILYLRNPSCPRKRKFLSVMLALWVILPPAWFAFEYFQLYKPYAQAGRMAGTFEAFKHGQDVAEKLWIAFTALLTGIRNKRPVEQDAA